MNVAQIRMVQLLATQVVLAAEQTLHGTGAVKKKLALQVLQEILDEQGLRPSRLVLDTAIESCVYLMNVCREELGSEGRGRDGLG